jgi:hypothetical protein
VCRGVCRRVQGSHQSRRCCVVRVFRHRCRAHPSLCPPLTLPKPSTRLHSLHLAQTSSWATSSLLCPLLIHPLACAALSLPFPFLTQLLACQTLSQLCSPPAPRCPHSSVAQECLDFTQHSPCKTFDLPSPLPLNTHRAIHSPHSALTLLPCCSHQTLCRALPTPCTALPSLSQPFALPCPPLAQPGPCTYSTLAPHNPR